MKYLTALSLLQTALIVFLLFKATGDEAPPPPAGTLAPAAPAPGGTWGSPVAAGPAPLLDESRLRQIIREELAAAGTPRAETFAPAPLDPAEANRRKAQVSQRISYYRSVGEISEPQMAELQVEIARLDPASRKEMLAMLSRAINAQEIKTQL